MNDQPGPRLALSAAERFGKPVKEPKPPEDEATRDPFKPPGGGSMGAYLRSLGKITGPTYPMTPAALEHLYGERLKEARAEPSAKAASAADAGSGWVLPGQSSKQKNEEPILIEWPTGRRPTPPATWKLPGASSPSATPKALSSPSAAPKASSKASAEAPGKSGLSRGECERLVDAYGAAWEAQDASAIGNLFTEDATYSERPFHSDLAVFRGRDAIREHWREQILGRQQNVRFGQCRDDLVLDSEKGTCLAKWDVSFEVRGRGGESRTVRMLQVAILKLKHVTYSGVLRGLPRIASFEEFWHSLSPDGAEPEWGAGGSAPHPRLYAAARMQQAARMQLGKGLMQGKGMMLSSMPPAASADSWNKGAAKGFDPTDKFNRCWDYDKGKCSRGSRCQYLHVDDGGKGGKGNYDAGRGNGKGKLGPVMLQVMHNGVPRELNWVSKEQAVGRLAEWGVLDATSAELLRRAPEHEARELVSSLGPEVRNPSAFVTRALNLRNPAAGAQAGAHDISVDRHAAELRAAQAAGGLPPGSPPGAEDSEALAAAAVRGSAAESQVFAAAPGAAEAEADEATRASAEAAAAEAAARAARRGARSTTSKLFVFGQAVGSDNELAGEMEPPAKRACLEPSDNG